jgi:hypothetical protein
VIQRVTVALSSHTLPTPSLLKAHQEWNVWIALAQEKTTIANGVKKMCQVSHSNAIFAAPAVHHRAEASIDLRVMRTQTSD